MKKLVIVLIMLPVLLFSQTRRQRKALEAQKKSDQQVISNLKNHSQFFTGTNFREAAGIAKDDDLTLEYISNQFKTIGIAPKGSGGFIQQFKMDDGKHIEPGTFLKVNGVLLTVKKDYFPLAFSASKATAGMPAMALREKGVPWFADIKDWIQESAKNDSGINKVILKEANRAILKGATALFIYNSSNLPDNVRFNKRDKIAALSIPVIYITSAAYNKYFTDQAQILDIELNVVLKEITKNVRNIIGFIDNGAASNILVATPYDKLGDEEKETTNITASDEVISGSSILIELARMLYKSKAKNNNYTFVGYSRADSLSKDSKWLNNSSIIANSNYIINLDKVSSLNENKKLTVSAYGISTDFTEIIKTLAGKELEVTFDVDSAKSKIYSDSQLKVPVFNFFTGSESDNRIQTGNGNLNYEGELNIAKFIYHIIEATDSKGKLTFAENFENLVKKNQAFVSAKQTEEFK